MRRSMILLGLLALGAVPVLGAPMTAERSAAAVLMNANFEEAGASDQLLPGWQVAGVVRRMSPGALGQWAALLKGTEQHPDAAVTQRVAVPEPPAGVVTLAGLVQTTAVESVDDDHHGVAEVTVAFFDRTGARIAGPRRLLTWFGDMPWKPWAVVTRLPPEAAEVELSLELLGAVGTAAFDGLELWWGFPDEADRQNLLVDGGFEYPGPLSSWKLGEGHAVVTPGASGRAAVRLQHQHATSAVTAQTWRLHEAPAAHRLQCALRVKLEGVTAASAAGGVRVELTFLDAADRLIERRTILGPWTGTTDWAPLTAACELPAGTRAGTIRLVMDDASGTAWCDELRLEARASSDALLARPLASVTDTSTWHPVEPSAEPLADVLDASDLLDPPAGRHGFLRVEADHFLFEDGTPIRFFGVNIRAAHAFPTHAHAEALAQRLAQLGCNIVRLHHLDTPGASPNIFDSAADDTQHFSAESLDRLDYFIAQLKARGIYVYLDLLVSRAFRAGDGVPAWRRLSRGAKVVAQYDPRIIALQQQYARALLTHRNPYTQTRYVDEPAIALVDLINESSLFRLPEEYRGIPRIYQEALEDLWVRYGQTADVSHQAGEAARWLDSDDPQVQQFYAAVQRRYFQSMRDFLRRLGLQIPIAGSNLALEGGDLQTNAEMDFIDRHAYWDHPKGGFGDLVQFHNRSMIDVMERHHLVAKLGRQQVAGKPLVVSEWNIAWPNEYRAAGPVLMAAYALFQGWDGLLQFDYDGELSPHQIKGNFDVSTKPELFLQFPAAARLFHRGDVMTARRTKVVALFPEREIPPALVLRHRVERSLEGGVRRPRAQGRGRWVSDTAELDWDVAQGLALIDTPRTQAAIGQVGDVAVALHDVRFAVETPFACLVLTSLDGQPLQTSTRLLLTTVARSENTGTVYNATRTLLRDSGRSPILMEPVEGAVSLSLGGRGVPQVFALDASGRRVGTARLLAHDDGSAEFPIGQAQAYEIVFGAGE